MSDDPTKDSASASEPRTAVDVRLDELSKQMNDMKAEYEATIAEYQKANKELYEVIHTPTMTAQADEPVHTGFDASKAAKAFWTAMGLRE